MKREFTVCMLLIAVMVLSAGTSAGEVNLWTQRATASWLLELVHQFTEETGIVVNLRQIGYGLEEMYVSLAGGVPPDLFTHGNAALGAFAGQGLLQPLEPMLAKWSFARDIIPPVLAVNTYDNRTLGLPWEGASVQDLIYRPDMLEEIGASDPPARWDDLVQVGRKLVRIGSDGVMTRSGLRMHRSGWDALRMFQMLHNQSGGALLQNGQPAFLTESGVNALQFYVDLFHAHQLDSLSFSSSVLSGTSAMEWQNNNLLAAGRNQDVTLRAATFPYSVQRATYMAANFIALPVAASNVDHAVTLLEFLLHPKQHERICEAFGTIPIYRQAARWSYFKENPELEHFIGAMSYGIPNPNHPKWIEIRDSMSPFVVDALQMKLPARTALVQADEKVRAVLSDSN